MIKEFIDFCTSLFPAISPYVKENVERAIKQFDYDTLSWFDSNKKEYLLQGDIIDDLPFVSFNSKGEIKAFKAKGIILSNTCDIDHDEHVIIAPLIDYNKLDYGDDTIRSIKENKNYDKMCFTCSKIENYFVDFTRMAFIDKTLLKKILKKQHQVEYTLSQYGYYFLLTKLTIYFMRPEDEGANKSRTAEERYAI